MATWLRAHRVPLALLAVYTIFLLLVLPWKGIQWGDGLEFVAVSSHLGVAHPPGYPLYTALGWLFLKVSPGEPYHAMLLISRLALIPIVACTFVVTRRLLIVGGLEELLASRLALIGAGALAISPFLVSQGHYVEVYALHGALVLGLVTLVLMSLRNDGVLSPGAMAGAGLLLGLAVSHHLTAAAFGPLFLLVLWKSAKANRAALWSLLIAGFVPLLAFLSITWRIPSDGNAHGIYWNSPREMAALVDHVRGGEYRQFQFLQLQPGVSFTFGTYLPFLGFRMMQLLSMLGAVFFGEGPTTLLGGVLIAGFAVHGFWCLWRHLPKAFSIGIAIAFALQLGFIFTYNIPDVGDYFLAVFLVAIPFFFAGFLPKIDGILCRRDFTVEKRRFVLVAATGVLVVTSLAQHLSPRPEIDPMDLPAVWRDRLLAEIPEGAAVLTAGDVDVYTLWYEQFARGNRRDILVYGSNFVRFPWFRYTLDPGDPRREAVAFRPAPPTTLQAHIEALRVCAIEPLLAHGPVYTTITQEIEIRALSQFYRLEPVASLLTESEFVALAERGSLYIPPPVLYEIRRNGTR